ncbi:MAG: hypothetical protein PHC86_01290 [Eubacteriales bacterium]|nr:hypothetical protein [Eubacteriales bacterium]
MFYLVPFILAILIGTIRSRQPKVLMLWELRAVFLLPLGFFLGLMPFWLATYWPDLIWTDDRYLLMTLQATSRGLFVLFSLINLVFALKQVDWAGIRKTLQQLSPQEILRNWAKSITRVMRARYLKAKFKRIGDELWHDLKHFDIKLAQLLSIHPRRILAPELQPAPHPKANRLRLWGLILAIIALIAQIMVLLGNQGYWPLSEHYLNWINDPLYVQGIRNGALRMQQLINEATSWPWLGQILPWPNLGSGSPVRVRYLSPTEPVLAVSLFLLTFSLFPARKKKPKRGKRS